VLQSLSKMLYLKTNTHGYFLGCKYVMWEMKVNLSYVLSCQQLVKLLQSCVVLVGVLYVFCKLLIVKFSK